jgi:hypothetical protein
MDEDAMTEDKKWDEVRKLYQIQAVPTVFILDQKGVIVAKNLRGEELDKKIVEIFLSIFLKIFLSLFFNILFHFQSHPIIIIIIQSSSSSHL